MLAQQIRPNHRKDRNHFKHVSVNGINVESIVIATIGAIALVLIVGSLNRSRGLFGR